MILIKHEINLASKIWFYLFGRIVEFIYRVIKTKYGLFLSNIIIHC